MKIARAKNGVLPLLAACLLTDEPCTIRRVPRLADVTTMVNLLESLGVEVKRSGSSLTLCAKGKLGTTAPYDIVRKMRASYYLLGPLLARFGHCRVSLPGGCAIGARPVDLHLRGIKTLGAKVKLEHGYVCCQSRRLRGARLLLDGPKGPSVGATMNCMMAAALAEGETVIDGAAREPEVSDLAGFLTAMGANIEGAGGNTITIHGKRRLHGACYTPIPDRIEAGTLAVAAAITAGSVEITGCEPNHLVAVIDALRRTGATVECSRRSIAVSMNGRPLPIDISTAPYPGFPTDLQAQFTSLLCLARGKSTVTENIFESRFLHCVELNRMAASIVVNGNVAIINGVRRLSGAQVMASDLRASAALVLAGLAAKGTTEVLRVYHLDRGYERLDRKLCGLGAKIERIS